MNRAGEQFLACAAFATNQYGRRALSDLGHVNQHIANGMAGAAHVVFQSHQRARQIASTVFVAARVFTAHQLALQKQDSPLLFGDLLYFFLQFAFERVDGAMSLSAAQGQGGGSCQSHQEVALVRGKGSAILFIPQEQQAHHQAVPFQGTTQRASQRLQLLLTFRRSETQTRAIVLRRDGHATGRQCTVGRDSFG